MGRITGLVLDCGHLESVTLPVSSSSFLLVSIRSDKNVQIFAARPLYPHLRTTPMAGAKLTSHLRALLLTFGTYLPPSATLSSAANIPAASRATRVPQEVLTDLLVEEIKTRCCFVGHAMDVSDADFRDMTPLVESSSEAPSDSLPSESGTSEAESEFSEMTGPGLSPSPGIEPGDDYLQAMSSIYKRHSTATDFQMRVVPPPSEQTGTGLGTLIIPGWIRERTAEVLFEGGDIDESSVAEVLLEALLRVRNPQWLVECFFYRSIFRSLLI